MKKQVRKGSIFMIMLALVLVLSACGGSGSGEKQKVVIYTSMYEDIIEVMEDVIEEQFDDIDVEFFQGGTGTIQAKVAAEISSGKLAADMLMVAETSYALELKEQGILEPIQIENPDSLAFEYDLEGYWYPVRVMNMILGYNPDLNSKDSVPNSFEQFANDSSQKGYISMPNPLTSGSALASVSALQDKYGDEYFDALAANNVVVESGSVALTKLETGEANSIMILEESILKKREEEGSTLEVIYPEDGTILIPSPIMTVKEDMSANANTDAAKRLTEWFLSEEGQKQITAGWMHSVLKDTELLPYDAKSTAEIHENLMPINWERTYKERDQIRNMFQEKITVPES